MWRDDAKRRRAVRCLSWLLTRDRPIQRLLCWLVLSRPRRKACALNGRALFLRKSRALQPLRAWARVKAVKPKRARGSAALPASGCRRAGHSCPHRILRWAVSSSGSDISSLRESTVRMRVVGRHNEMDSRRDPHLTRTRESLLPVRARAACRTRTATVSAKHRAAWFGFRRTRLRLEIGEPCAASRPRHQSGGALLMPSGSSRTRHLPNRSTDPAPVGQARYFVPKTLIHHSKYDAPYRIR